jgi:hypothetical protein
MSSPSVASLRSSSAASSAAFRAEIAPVTRSRSEWIRGPLGLTLLRRHAAKRLQKLRDRTLLAERRDPLGLKALQVPRAFDSGQPVAAHMVEIGHVRP